jgi:hypothetical protein
MKTSAAAFGVISLLVAAFPLVAKPEATEAELRALETELNREQEKLDERRRDLELRKLQLKLRKEGRDVPSGAELTPHDRAAQLARLQALAHAEKTRALWIGEWGKLGESLENLKKGDGRMGSPKAFGPKAKEMEARNQAARKQIETRLDELENLILTSMQTTLAESGGLNDTEFAWLESRTSGTGEDSTALDEAALRWMESLLKMEKKRRKPPGAAAAGKPAPILVE